MVKQFIGYFKKLAFIILFLILIVYILEKVGFRFNIDLFFLLKILFLLSLIWLIPLIKFLILAPEIFQKSYQEKKKDFFNQLKIVKRKIEPFLIRKWVDWGLIPLLLLFLGAVLTGVNLFYSEDTFSVLVENFDQKNFVSWQNDELLAGEKIVVEFETSEDNLGIVSVRFNTFERLNEDVLIFRLREKGKMVWYYENEYKTDQFLDNELFPFGFRKINDSKGKTYQFEIESTLGEKGNAIAISSSLPVFRVKYEFDRANLLANKTELIKHVFKKSLNMVHNYIFLLSSLVFFIPFLFYLFYLLRKKPLFTFKMANDFFIIVILTFLAVLWVSFMEEFLTNFFGVVIETDNFWELPTNFLVFWIVVSVVVNLLRSEKA